MKHARAFGTRQIAAALLLLPSLGLTAPTTINWWHSHGGAIAEKIQELCDGFNQSHREYQVVPAFKGNYAVTMNAGIAAARAGNPPHILEVYEVGTATMMAARDIMKPVHQLMLESGLPFDAGDYLPTIARYYSTLDGRMLSMPFNSSTPVLYYNKDMFRKAGLDPEKPPVTWPAMEAAARKLLGAGICEAGFSSDWNGWIHLENLSAWHDEPVGTRENGFSGLDTVYTFNRPLQVKHIQQLADWRREKVFAYGRNDSGYKQFVSGKVAMYTYSSTGYASLTRNCGFEVGTAMLPYWPDVKRAPQNTIIGGASLWVTQGHKERDYNGVAAFLNHLSRPEVMADWHQTTGYLPITRKAYELTRKQGFYEKNPGAEIPLKQLTMREPTGNSHGLRFGDHASTRVIIDDQLEAVFAGRKTAQQGLNDAVEAGNALLRKFESANRH